MSRPSGGGRISPGIKGGGMKPCGGGGGAINGGIKGGGGTPIIGDRGLSTM